MRTRSYLSLTVAAVATIIVQACSQTPVIVPLRSMERPKDVDFICLRQVDSMTWEGADLSKCAVANDGTTLTGGEYRLHAVVTQQSRGELAVADLGRVPGDPATLAKIDPRIPGYSFLPVTAVPSDVVADPGGQAVYVASGRDPRIEIVPANLLRGPIDSRASSGNESPWPRIDLDRVNDGTPGALTIQREGEWRRLYVTLPEAAGGPKLAVFDLTKPLTPARMPDITLTFTGGASIACLPTACGPNGETQPWWVKRAEICTALPTPTTDPTLPCLTVPAPTKMHLSGISLVGGKLYAADDAAQVVHVFDIYGGTGVEIARLPVGAETSRVSVSPVVPDEVTRQNFPAIEVCRANGWLGDGLDHTADSPTVAKLLGGRCVAHRYLYAVDLSNSVAGDGSLAIVDLPVTFADALDRRVETVDFANAKLVQALACDAPQFPAQRLWMGPFGVGPGNSVPARAITFVEVDPDLNGFAPQRAARCRAFNRDDYPKIYPDPAAPTDAARNTGAPDLSVDDKVAPNVKDERVALGEEWRGNGVDPRRLRGVFAYVAMTNGAIVVVDVDDYDSMCRGPKSASTKPVGPVFSYAALANAETPSQSNGPNVPVDEYLPRPVRRHHPRSLRLFDSNFVPSVGAVSLSQNGTSLTNDRANETGRTRPSFISLATGADARPIYVLPATDNPYSLTSEVWSVTYQGALPSFANELGRFAQENGKIVVRGGIAYCGKGIEAPGTDNDIVEVVDQICPYDTCTPAEHEACVEEYGEASTVPVSDNRGFKVEKAFDDHLVLEATSLTKGTVDFNTCFGRKGDPLPLLKFTVRSRNSWVVVGSLSGFLHRQMADAATGECVTDLSRPVIQTGRAKQRPATAGAPAYCDLFTNPSWQFAIVEGTDIDPDTQQVVPTASQTDMRFTFGGRFAFQPLSLAAGVLLQSVKTIDATWDGKEQLGWHMIATVDAVERGLFVFPGGAPYSFQKQAN